MTEDMLVPALFLVTIALVLVVAGWQYRRARQARRDGEHSADARVHGDRRGAPRHADRDSDGTP